MTMQTKKKLCALICGCFVSTFFDAAWYLPDVRIHEGLDWRIEVFVYLVTALPAIFFAWLSLGDD